MRSAGHQDQQGGPRPRPGVRGLRCPPTGQCAQAAKVRRRKGIKEGGVYEVMVEDVGRKGDGVAKLDKYIIYVPGEAREPAPR